MPMLLFYRLLFILELFVAELLFVIRMRKRKLFVLRYAAGIAVCALIAWALPLIYDTFYTAFTFLALFSASVPILKFCLKESWRNVLFCAIAAYTMQHFAYGVANFVMTLVVWGQSPIFGMYSPGEFNINNFGLETVLIGLVYLLAYYVSYTLVYFIYGRRIKLGESFRIRSTTILLFVGIALVTVIFFNCVVVYFSDKENIIMTLLVIIYEEFLCFFLLNTQFGLIRTGELKNELSVTQYLLREKERQYNLSKENIELINLKCHDLRHQIRQIGKDKGLSLGTVGEIESAISIYDAEVRTDNEVLDIILTEKSLRCALDGIALTCVADGHSLDFMEDTDIYSLFGNALDNAIEAVSRLEKERRNVGVVVRSINNLVSVNVRNSYDGEITLDADGLPLTTKSDKNFHGIGVKSIRQIAEKYNGTCSVSLNNGVFNLNVLVARKNYRKG